MSKTVAELRKLGQLPGKLRGIDGRMIASGRTDRRLPYDPRVHYPELAVAYGR